MRTIGAAVVGVLAGGAGLGLIGAGVTAGLGSGVAGADSTGYLLTCTLGGTKITIPGTITTGTLPASVTAGKGFTLTNYGMKFSFPATGLFGDAATLTVGVTLTTTVTATGATPATQTTTITLPTTTFPPKATFPVHLSASGSPVHLTAGTTGGTATVSTGTTGTLAVTVNHSATPLDLSCTSPAETIASTTVAAPHPTVTAVLPNAGPLAGGETVTVEGTFLTGASAVDFGTTPATTVTVTTAHALTATEPPGTAGTVDVTVTTPLGTSPVTTTDHFTYTNGPIVTGVSPDTGPPTGGTTVTLTGLQFTTATAVTFGTTPATSFIQSSATTITAVDPPGTGTVDVTVTNPKGTSVVGLLDRFTYTSLGYWTVASDGGIFSFGGATFYGSMGGTHLNAPVVAMAPTPTAGGYWEVASDGGIFAFGSAQFYGSMGGTHLNAPIVAMAPTPTGTGTASNGTASGGYWEVASDGGIFAFGNAPFYGSMGGKHLSAPIVSMVAAPTGTGYWEVGANGTIYAFGTTGLYGSMGGKALNAPIVAAAATSDFGGDWEAASDGGVFSFGNAGYYGSMGGQPLNQPIVGMATTVTGTGAASGGAASGGYWLVASDGGIFSFGDATFSGSMGGQPLNAPMVGMAAA